MVIRRLVASRTIVSTVRVRSTYRPDTSAVHIGPVHPPDTSTVNVSSTCRPHTSARHIGSTLRPHTSAVHVGSTCRPYMSAVHVGPAHRQYTSARHIRRTIFTNIAKLFMSPELPMEKDAGFALVIWVPVLGSRLHNHTSRNMQFNYNNFLPFIHCTCQ